MISRIFGSLRSGTFIIPGPLPSPPVLSTGASSTSASSHHSAPASNWSGLAGASLCSVLPSGLLGFPEDRGEVHRPVLREQSRHLLAHPGHQLLTVPPDLDGLPLVPRVVEMLNLKTTHRHQVRQGQESPTALTLLKLRSPVQIQSILKTPPSALAERPGGRIQLTLAPSRRDSVASRATPQNLPDS